MVVRFILNSSFSVKFVAFKDYGIKLIKRLDFVIETSSVQVLGRKEETLIKSCKSFNTFSNAIEELKKILFY